MGLSGGLASNGTQGGHVSASVVTGGSAILGRSVLLYGPLGTSSPGGSYGLLAGGTQAVGDGSGTKLSQVYSTLAAARGVYSFAANLNQTIDYCAIQAALRAAAATSGAGGRVLANAGHYVMNNAAYPGSQLVWTGPHGNVDLVGEAGFTGSPLTSQYGYATLLDWPSDVATAPFLTFAIDMTPSAGAPSIRHLAVQLPLTHSGSGCISAALAGIRRGSRSYLECVSIYGGSCAEGLGGGIAYGFPNDAGFDHSGSRQVYVTGPAFARFYLPGSTSAGDESHSNCQLAAHCAGIAIAQSASSGLTGTDMTGFGLYANVGVLRFNDGSVAGGGNVNGNQLLNVSFEQSYDAAFFDELYADLTGKSGAFYANFWSYVTSPTQASPLGWQTPSTAVSASGSNTITLTDSSGFFYRPGMTVTGTGIPANTTVTDISGGWGPPGALQAYVANPTLTLSNVVTAPTAVVVAWPKLGGTVFGAIYSNMLGTLGSNSSYPTFYGGANGGHDNTGPDAAEVLVAAKSTPLWGGAIGPGNILGSGASGDMLISGRMGSGVSCAAGDVLMCGQGSDRLQQCDGTSRPIGVALMAATSNNPVDVQAASVHTYNKATVNNRNAAAIAAYALLKVDLANPGGVTTATSMSDGMVIGRNDSVQIAGTSTGTVAQLWIDSVSSGGPSVSSATQGLLISGTPTAGQILTATSSTAADWAANAAGGGTFGWPGLVAPYNGWIVVQTVANPAASNLHGVRVVCPKGGTLHDVAVYVGVSSGNIIGAVYDTGDALAGSYSQLATSGSVACPAANGWRVIWDPALTVVAQQQLVLAFTVDNGTATFGRPSNGFVVTGAAAQLPTSFLPASGGAAPKLLMNYAPGSFTAPSPIAEATWPADVISGAPYLIIARIV